MVPTRGGCHADLKIADPKSATLTYVCMHACMRINGHIPISKDKCTRARAHANMHVCNTHVHTLTGCTTQIDGRAQSFQGRLHCLTVSPAHGNPHALSLCLALAFATHTGHARARASLSLPLPLSLPPSIPPPSLHPSPPTPPPHTHHTLSLTHRERAVGVAHEKDVFGFQVRVNNALAVHIRYGL
jgi:hypothetical protein